MRKQSFKVVSDIDVPKSRTWDQILKIPGLWSSISDDTFLILVTNKNDDIDDSVALVIYLYSEGQSGQIFKTRGQWDGKYVPYKGQLTLSNDKDCS